ncbi:thioredoxin family protein [Paenibacillus sp. y28]|uniref:thioredoxin family protein n=1 Tax=Paenibacillus sp. y28 TaxID=3129110 RepID=UPI00301A1D45
MSTNNQHPLSLTMPDLNEAQLRELYWRSGEAPWALYLYTPFCGTCKLAARMLSIVLEAKPDLRIVSGNVLYLPQLVAEWQIQSVPCLLIIRDRRIVQKQYALRSVSDMYTLLQEVQPAASDAGAWMNAILSLQNAGKPSASGNVYPE